MVYTTGTVFSLRPLDVLVKLENPFGDLHPVKGLHRGLNLDQFRGNRTLGWNEVEADPVGLLFQDGLDASLPRVIESLTIFIGQVERRPGFVKGGGRPEVKNLNVSI